MFLRNILLSLALAAALGAPVSAEAQSLKKVSASKYETRSPAKGYSFRSIRPLSEWFRAARDYPDDIYIVNYKSDESSDELHGILDKRGKRAEWLLQPHFEYIDDFGPNSLAVKQVLYDDTSTYCVLNLANGTCPKTEFTGRTKLSYRDYEGLPSWMNDQALYVKTETPGLIDLQLYAANQEQLTIVRDVMFGPLNGSTRRTVPKVYGMDDELIVRTKSEDGTIRDAVLSQTEDGKISVSYVPPYSILEIDDSRYPAVNGRKDFKQATIRDRDIVPMYTMNAEIGLVWPRYNQDGEDRPTPDGLLGLMPIFSGFQRPRYISEEFGDAEVAAHYCCDNPLGWAVVWEDEDSAAYALIPGMDVPDYERVAASRAAALYSQIEPLWRPGIDSGYNEANAKRKGELVGKFAMHRKDGTVEIFAEDRMADPKGQSWLTEASMPAAQFPSWLSQAMEAQATTTNEMFAAYKARQEQRRAEKEAYDLALSQQRARLKREREERQAAAAARRTEQAAARPQEPTGRTVKVYGNWTSARIGYCNDYTRQTDLYAEASAKKACRDQGGQDQVTYVVESGYDPFAASADQCYSALAVTECYFD